MTALNIHERADWRRFAGPDWLQRIMHLDVTDQFHAKQGRSTGRCVFQCGDSRLSIFLKRHYQLPWWMGLLARALPRLACSPALQERRNLLWAKMQGIPVPEAVAAGEFLVAGRLQSFLAVEELTGMIPLHEAIPAAARKLDSKTFALWKRTLIAELARLANELHRRRRFHKDLYLCHFFIRKEDITDNWTANETVPSPPSGEGWSEGDEHPGDFDPLTPGPSPPRGEGRNACGAVPVWRDRVCMIDLHRLAYHPCTWRIWQIKDIAQFMFSSDLPGITARDRLRFWRLYYGPARTTMLGRLLASVIHRKWLRYLRHNERRYGYRRVVSFQQSAVSGQRSAFSGQQSAISGQQSAISDQTLVVGCASSNHSG